MAMGKIRAELRVYAKADGQYALLRYVNYNRNDIYAGTGFIDGIGSNLFRASYHETGKNHIHIPVKPGKHIGVEGEPPSKLTDKRMITSGGGDLRMLKWSYGKPKKEKKNRKTLILDVEKIPVARCNVEVWIAPAARQDLIDEVLEEHNRPGTEVVATLKADWCDPEIIVVVWMLDDNAQSILENSIAKQFPIRI